MICAQKSIVLVAQNLLKSSRSHYAGRLVGFSVNFCHVEESTHFLPIGGVSKLEYRCAFSLLSGQSIGILHNSRALQGVDNCQVQLYS